MRFILKLEAALSKKNKAPEQAKPAPVDTIPEEEEEEVIDYELPEAEEATTTLGSLFKNIKLD